MSEHLQMLTGQDLHRAIVGHALRRADLSAADDVHVIEEQFEANGTWRKMGTRVPLVGSYRLLADRVCVEYPRGTTTCRVLYRDGSGGYSAVDLATGGAKPAVKITLHPLK